MYKRLEEVLIERGISKGQLAIRSNILPCNLYQAMKGKVPFHPRWRKSVSEVLGVPEDELFPQYCKNIKGA